MENELEKAQQLIAEKIKQDDDACIAEINEVLKKYGRLIEVKNQMVIKQTDTINPNPPPRPQS
ncbi:hypothetical protein [uncultured Clostridium sp.]|uniref:hypothetical protein n=1 Tax=uncultured Clostridium sp. TaxID=59620 RepID=UPI00260CC916|nr:hypothetical protein [uncultured Clostridium sp.]